ncbi:flagellar hook-associated protein FlgK [Actinokineospora auranticolor]|uniref:Flagellar hook-associated protein 1 n=1 Tax=Actinokineospora auranticolor TaxID=155976 RepID=A0A2S6GMM5_9PSEU|nr:flagellar hook-associated protein FlgK [Actinokineospora auranticolor]PPK66467.1 flagellar hook-associated protein 1 FlgK [Actinokineospora auranticolor]
MGFNGINTALTALRVQRQGLELAGQNIANAGTEGYTRQRLETTAIGGSAVPAFWSTQPVGSSGGGVQTTSVNRLQDAYVEARTRYEHERQATTSTAHEVLVDAENVYNEPGANGLQAQLTNLWAGFTDVGDNPSDSAARTQLLTRLQTVATGLNSAASELSGQFGNRRTELASTVNDVNSAAAQLADLNGAVLRAKAAGVSYNDLSDKRDVVAMKLIEQTGAQVSEAADGTYTVSLGGSNLVSGSTARALKVTGTTDIATATTNPVTVKWVDTDTATTGVTGKAGALTNALTTVLPGQLTGFNNVAAALANQVNTANAAGWTTSGTAGGALLSGTTAATIAVVTSDPAAIAASANKLQAYNGDNADYMARLGSIGTADGIYRTNVADIGMKVRSAEQAAATQDSITTQVDAARQAASGVNLDEELTSMISYQRSYEAAAKVMSAVDSMLDTLINRMGA